MTQTNSALSIEDPVFHLYRPRVVAEVCASCIRLTEIGALELSDQVRKMISWLVEKQSPDGSWSDLHPFYSGHSAFCTAIVGSCLLDASRHNDGLDLAKPLHKAAEFVLSEQLAPGYFRKSTAYAAEHLNVNAICSAFLAEFGAAFSLEDSVRAAANAAMRVCRYQTRDGVFPYTTSVPGSPYRYALDVPCIHYQGVTIYYLLKANRVLKLPIVAAGIRNGVYWLSSQQTKSGRFDWSNSLLGFSLYLTAAYAFAVAAWSALAGEDPKNCLRAQSAIHILKENSRGLLLRWEKISPLHVCLSFFNALRVTSRMKYSASGRPNLLAYRCYRELARARYSASPSSNAFEVLSRLFRMQTSTIEPMHNYPDMYTTAQALEGLTYSLCPPIT